MRDNLYETGFRQLPALQQQQVRQYAKSANISLDQAVSDLIDQSIAANGIDRALVRMHKEMDMSGFELEPRFQRRRTPKLHLVPATKEAIKRDK